MIWERVSERPVEMVTALRLPKPAQHAILGGTAAKVLRLRGGGRTQGDRIMRL